MEARQLSAILFADIVGYTAIMQRDEGSGLQKVMRFRDVVERQVKRYQGKVQQFYGDGCLVTFSSGILALKCAKEIQESLKRGDVEVPLRIGIHIGDIVVKHDAIFGNGVNLASRIESLGVPGSILFSERLVADIKNQPEFQFVSLGEFDFKNVDHPMEVFALANVGFPKPKQSELEGKLKLSDSNDQLREHSKASIAVLPFTDMSSSRDQEYFAQGIAEEILNTLSQLKELKVSGRTSSFSIKEKGATITEIGESLKVSYVLEGSVRKQGSKIRITTQLISVSDGFQVWAQKYDDDFTDIFKIQDTVAEHVANALLEKFTSEQRSKLKRDANQNSEAYELFLRARHVLTRFLAAFDPEDFRKAEALFSEAIRIEPNYAPAHAGLADLYDTYVVWRVSRQNKEVFEKFDELRIKESELAYTIGPNMAYVCQIKARVMLNTMAKLEDVYEILLRTYALNPNSPDVFIGLMNVYIRKGLADDALTFADRALALDPLHTWAYTWKIYTLGLLGEYELAIQESQIALEVNANEVIILANLASCYAFLGNKEAALATYARVNQINPDYLNRDPYFQIKQDVIKDPTSIPDKIPYQPSIALYPIGNVELDFLSGDESRFRRNFQAWWKRWKTGAFTSDLSFFSAENCSIYLHLKGHSMYHIFRDKDWFVEILAEEKEKYDDNYRQFLRPRELVLH